MTFKDLGLGKASLTAVEELGFTEPTAIQEKVIPKLLTGNRDIIALSQTGTGKTAAFGLPIVEKTDLENRATQTLILAPTRELCGQITSDITSYGRYIPGLRIVPVYGGSDMNR
ncbi:MAG: DEAD/DEAH box helicase, partial [bacterium]